ncbi:DUF3253 domain-containing protein [Balneola sp. MJW-20]|uniref:DUF3253 domain-containing protein n=1 Tax=Gracilimonas aurantiaca TaxID=3234185 RepID=UPI0034675621
MRRSGKEIENEILRLCRDRGKEKSICPSEVCRSLDPENWRKLMPVVMEKASDLHHQKKVRILQKGTMVEDPEKVMGPVRIQIHT